MSKQKLANEKRQTIYGTYQVRVVKMRTRRQVKELEGGSMVQRTGEVQDRSTMQLTCSSGRIGKTRSRTSYLNRKNLLFHLLLSTERRRWGVCSNHGSMRRLASNLTQNGIGHTIHIRCGSPQRTRAAGVAVVIALSQRYSTARGQRQRAEAEVWKEGNRYALRGPWEFGLEWIWAISCARLPPSTSTTTTSPWSPPSSSTSHWSM